jgi:hypothetical protein
MQIDYVKIYAKKIFIFVVQTLQEKWSKILMKQLARGQRTKNNCLPRPLKFEMVLAYFWGVLYQILPESDNWATSAHEEP